MNPTRLRAWVRKYGRLGLLFVGCLLGLHHLWVKRRTAVMVSASLLCILVGLEWHYHNIRPVDRTADLIPVRRQAMLTYVSFTQPASSADALAADLRAGFQQYPDSYQRFLRHSFHATRNALEDQEWAAIEPSLKAQGFHMEDQDVGGGSRRYKVTLDGLAYQPASGPRHDLVIDFEVSPKASRTAPTRMMIRFISVSLSAKFNRPFADVARRPPYPKGSILDAFLQVPELTKVAARYPLLETIELEYHQPIFGRGVSYGDEYSVPYGFRISVNFMRYEQKTKYTKGMDYEASSDLDPPATGDSKKDLIKDFVPKDTFGKIVRGRTEWGSGGPPSGGFIERVDKKPWTSTEPVDLRIAYSIADLKLLPVATKSLELRDGSWTNVDFAELARFKDLTYLDMLQCQGDPNDSFNEGGYQALAKLTKLEHLELQGDGITDGVCKAISDLKGLTYLRIYGDNITDAGIRHLVALPRLESLIVSCKQLTNSSLHTIGALHGLRNLIIFDCGEFSDAGLRELGGLKLLEVLSIEKSKHITSHGFAFLSHLPALTNLSLCDLSLDDAVLDAVSRLSQLKSLSLLGLSEITDIGIMRLHTLSRIEWLYVQGCPKVTTAGMRRLKAALPGQYTVD